MILTINITCTLYIFFKLFQFDLDGLGGGELFFLNLEASHAISLGLWGIKQ